MLSSVKYWLWLTDLLEPSAAWAVFCHFGSPERAYFSDPEEYERIEGLSPQQRGLLHDKSTSAAEALMARCDSKNIRILTFSDTDFPERLRNIDVPPLVLYLRGRMVRFDERAVIAMAGTRRATPYGAKMATDFARDISKGGGVVATGIVTGCDENAAWWQAAWTSPITTQRQTASSWSRSPPSAASSARRLSAHRTKVPTSAAGIRSSADSPSACSV